MEPPFISARIIHARSRQRAEAFKGGSGDPSGQINEDHQVNDVLC